MDLDGSSFLLLMGSLTIVLGHEIRDICDRNSKN